MISPRWSPDGQKLAYVSFELGKPMVVVQTLASGQRKVVARFQDRVGPNRIGPFGLIQPFADIIKLVVKEDITPAGADKVVYNIAPVLSAMSVIALWAILPLALSERCYSIAHYVRPG